MKKITLIALSISALTTSALGKKFSVHHPEMKSMWSNWKKNHTKSYDDDEEPTKMDTFVNNYNSILEHNASPSKTVTLALNHFADLTEEEFAAQYLGSEVIEQPSNNFGEEDGDGDENDDEEENARLLASLPASVDWRTKGAVGPVKNQAHCGGCWSFAATGALEGLHYIKTGKLLSFSEQQLLNCDKVSHGCKSGFTDHSFAYTSTYGVELESTNPFRGVSGSCNYLASKSSRVNTGHVNVPKKNMAALLAAVVKQPVAITLNGGVNAFRFYKSGVLSSGCASGTSHAVLVVGYTTVNGQQALIVKNSWGSGWGNKGYLYISTASANSGYGVCGVLTNPSYPTA